jgi:hypothetical protein
MLLTAPMRASRQISDVNEAPLPKIGFYIFVTRGSWMMAAQLPAVFLNADRRRLISPHSRSMPF